MQHLLQKESLMHILHGKMIQIIQKGINLPNSWNWSILMAGYKSLVLDRRICND